MSESWKAIAAIMEMTAPREIAVVGDRWRVQDLLHRIPDATLRSQRRADVGGTKVHGLSTPEGLRGKDLDRVIFVGYQPQFEQALNTAKAAVARRRGDVVAVDDYGVVKKWDMGDGEGRRTD